MWSLVPCRNSERIRPRAVRKKHMYRTAPVRIGAFGAFVLAGALVLTGCSSDTPEDSAAAADAAKPAPGLLPAAEGSTSYPLELESPWGSTTLEERPERIAAITPSQDDVEALVAIGVTPILVSEDQTDVWVQRELDQEIEGRFSVTDGGFNVEQIAAADPDLIVVLGADVSADYDKLAAIAPVLSTATTSEGESSVANDWATSITALGEALDLSEAADRALETEEEFFADFRAEHPEFDGKTASYVVYYGAESGLQYHSTPDSPAGLTLSRMGFEPSDNASELEYRAVISNEMLSAIDADVVIFSDNSDGHHADLTDSALFQALSAVKNDALVIVENHSVDGYFVIDGTEYDGNLSWGLARSGPLSSTWAAEQMAPALADVLGAE
ncbi:ABC transporter substrate-binding protein [Microbacterium nanhaiense]|nr:ABC transporter substrate-binding protein [Microbacterium nanhaiense]